MSSRLSDFASKVLDGLRACAGARLAPGSRCLAAVSGGPDSTALAAALAEIAASGELRFELFLAHFDHAIREDSARDAGWVERLAARLGAAFLAERGDVPALRARERLGLEEAARKARLSFLERSARGLGAALVATGHTADDQAETVLFRILRGTGLKGLAGIPGARPISPESPEVLLVRPMLAISRDEVLAYLAGRGLEFLTDPTNRDTANQARARIRHEVLPEIERRLAGMRRVEGGGWRVEDEGASSPSTFHLPPSTFRSALLSLARSAAGAQASLAHAAGMCLAGAEVAPGEARLPLSVLELPPALRTEAFALAAERMGAKLPVPRGGLARAAAVLARTSVGARAETRGLVAERGYDRVTLRRARARAGVGDEGRGAREQLPGWSVPVAVPGETVLPAGRLVARVLERRGFDLKAFLRTKTSLVEVFDLRIFQPQSHEDTKDRCPEASSARLCALCGEGPALVCRTRRPGDRFRPFGSAGEKKLKAFLIDRKLPRSERDGLPLLVLEGSGVQVPGSGSGVFDPGAPNSELGTRNQEPSVVLWAVGLRLSELARVPEEAERVVVVEYVADDAKKAEG